ncbi:MAG TPA: tyrosinase family protein [Pyrinomonadaceae bacterium]|nr:tyrosinase family protein [Pyrinomonadaceae bacterium]
MGTTEDKAEGTQPPRQTRYERVKRILTDAQGAACPSYQGYGRFWELPLEEFLQVSIYGIRMIAPTGMSDFCAENMPAPQTPRRSCCSSEEEFDPFTGGPEETTSDADLTSPPEETCCGSSASASASTGDVTPGKARSPGRGAASGLIKGLKGQYPFDGTQFPRLPWGGSAVKPSDIHFIQDWIDDNCPATDDVKSTTTAATAGDAGSTPISVSYSSKLARARGHEEHPPSDRSVNEFNHDAGKVKARVNVEFLSQTELDKFRRAVGVMMCYDDFQQYDQRSFAHWASIHANNCQHGWEQFLSWHRLYLANFEQQLQDIDPTVTLPYWDWPMYRENVIASVKDLQSKKPFDNGVVPEAYQCWVSEQMLVNLAGKVSSDILSKLRSVLNKKFNSGNRLYVAAGIDYTGSETDDFIMGALKRVNPLWERYRWPGGDADIIFEAYPTPGDVDRILQIPNFYTFGSGPASNHFFGALENIHNLIHNFTGGMNPNASQFPNETPTGLMVSAGTTAYDPIFWAHHSNVDRLWSEWQALHPGATPDDPTDILAPWPLQVQDVYNISNLGYEYLKSAHVYETDNRIPITRFKSAKTTIHPAVLENHRRAEISLHKIQYSTAGGAFIRIFLNEPDADKNTEIRGNDHFVAQVATFSGDCIGGPGHCDPPPEHRRKFDQRARHRKTPGNFRLDVTDTVAKLKAKGETDFHINLVVLGLDGQPKPDALRLDAVSLTFKD